ncbi:MAG: helicase-related protein, partial [Bacteroidota bacterium]
MENKSRERGKNYNRIKGIQFKNRQEMQEIKEAIEGKQLEIADHVEGVAEQWASRVVSGESNFLAMKGPTGSGKSMYSPLIAKRLLKILHGHPNKESIKRGKQVLMIQPTRPATTNAARGLSALHGQMLGGSVGMSSSDASIAPEANIRVITPGVLIGMIQNGQVTKDAIGAIVIDETHSKSEQYSLIFGLLKILDKQKKLPPTLFTSAHFDTQSFADHFGFDAEKDYREFEERLFPIDLEETEIEDSNVKEKLVGLPKTDDGLSPEQAKERATILKNAVDEDLFRDHVGPCINKALEYAHEPAADNAGDILVFLTGAGEIKQAVEKTVERLGDLGKGFDVVGLYGAMPPSERQAIINGDKPKGVKRRIIFSTNIAETSVTIPNIGFVVDSGRRKVLKYNPTTRTQEYRLEYISKEEALQRAGRAGRNAAGKSFRLIPKELFEFDDVIEPFRQTDLKNVNLSSLYLQTKVFGYDLQDFPFMEKPFDDKRVAAAKRELIALKALTPELEITDLGRALAKLPFEPRLGKLFIKAADSGNLTQAVVTSALDSVNYIFEGQPHPLVIKELELSYPGLRPYQRDSKQKKRFGFEFSSIAKEIEGLVRRDPAVGGFTIPKRYELFRYIKSKEIDVRLTDSEKSGLISQLKSLGITGVDFVKLTEEMSDYSHDPDYRFGNDNSASKLADLIVLLCQRQRRKLTSDVASQSVLYNEALQNGLFNETKEYQSEKFEAWCEDYNVTPNALRKVHQIAKRHISNLSNWRREGKYKDNAVLRNLNATEIRYHSLKNFA